MKQRNRISCTFGVSIPKDDAEIFYAICREQDVTPSAMMRVLVEDLIERKSIAETIHMLRKAKSIDGGRTEDDG